MRIYKILYIISSICPIINKPWTARTDCWAVIYCLWFHNQFEAYSTRTCMFSTGLFLTWFGTLKQWISWKLWSFNVGTCWNYWVLECVPLYRVRLRSSSWHSPTMKMVATNFLRNLGSYLNGGIFHNTIRLRILLNDDLFSKSKNYTVNLRGRGAAQIHS